MRLIDAGLVLDNLSGRLESMKDYDAVKDVINNIPNAYDVDKVVEQLEELGQKMSESKSIQKYGESSPANHRYYKAVSVKRAIEIVKGGGVNAKTDS